MTDQTQAPAKPKPVDTGVKQADVEVIKKQADAKREARNKSSDSPATTPAPVATPAATPAGDDGESAGDGSRQPDDLTGKDPDWYVKKIGKLTKREKQAQERASAAEAKLAALEGQRTAPPAEAPAPAPTPTPAASNTPDRPKFEQFGGDTEKYLEALSDWKVERALAERDEKAKRQAVETEKRKRMTTLRERETQFAADHPDYFDKAYKSPINYSPDMIDFVTESEKGPEIAYYLAEHLDEAATISQLPPHRRAIALDRLESKLKIAPAADDDALDDEDDDDPVAPPAPPARKVTKAPAPPATVHAGGAPTRSATDAGLSTAERIAKWRQGDRNRRRRR